MKLCNIQDSIRISNETPQVIHTFSRSRNTLRVVLILCGDVGSSYKLNQRWPPSTENIYEIRQYAASIQDRNTIISVAIYGFWNTTELTVYTVRCWDKF